MRNVAANIALLLVSLLTSLLIIEGVLHLWQPFEYRVKGDRIVLPVNRSYVIRPRGGYGLDAEIHHTKNILGFRGPEPPADFDAALSLIAVGGSTTESFYVSDGDTWPDLVDAALDGALSGVWMNNAGMDGHTTFGHMLLLEDFLAPLRPNVVMFLVGWNDIGREGAGESDRRNVTSGWRNRSLRGWVYLIANRTELGGLALNGYRLYKAHRMGLGHDVTFFDWAREISRVKVTPESAERVLAEHRAGPVAAYAERLRRLVATARGHGIRPVLITQPTAYGPDSDPRTGLALGEIATRYGNGAVSWRVLELYNDAARGVAAERGVLLIDLAARMPKDSTYFYDPLHFNVPGSRKVAEIVTDTLCPWLQAEFPAHVTGPCAPN